LATAFGQGRLATLVIPNETYDLDHQQRHEEGGGRHSAMGM
jgi:hypothetical protein